MTKCKQCNTETTNQKFCGTKCTLKWHYHNNPQFKTRVKKNAKDWYNKHKNDTEYKKKQYERVKKWIHNNRDKHNKKMLELWKKRYQKRKTNHQCTRCKKTEQNKILCTECYQKKQKYTKNKNKVNEKNE